MSITFSVAIHDDDYIGHAIHCFEEEYSSEPNNGHGPDREFATYQEAADAYAAAVSAGTASRQCCSLSPRYRLGDLPSVNMANSNALDMLEQLGLNADDEPAWCGSVDPEDLRGRILLARALGADMGRPVFRDVGSHGAQLFDAGRPPGYFAEKFDLLDEVIAAAIHHGRTVVWS